MRFFCDSPYGLNEASVGITKTEAALQAAVIAAMYAAVALSAFTCSVDAHTYSTQDTNNVMRRLAECKFTASLVGNNIVITW